MTDGFVQYDERKEINMGEEIWKDIDGHFGIYQISNFGRIKSLDRISPQGNRLTGKIKHTYDNGNGYEYVDLSDNNAIRTKASIHRLVAFAFVENPNNYPQVNHKDENKYNNHYLNLEWCTQKYNNNYGNHSENSRIAHLGINMGADSVNAKKVVCLTTKEYFDCVKDASVYYKIENMRSHISVFCNKNKKYNYIGRHPETKEKLTWMYYDEYINLYNFNDLSKVETKDIRSA